MRKIHRALHGPVRPSMTGHPLLPADPIPARERIAELDALRGWALMGVFVANLAGFAGWFGLDDEARAALPTAAFDGAAWTLTHVFVTGKFYTLFSLLFGMGFALQMHRAERRGDGFASRYRRRLTVLLGIGLIHMGLIWYGDILALYAVCGFVLLAFRSRADRALRVWATVLISLPVVQYAAMWAVYDPEHLPRMAAVNPGLAAMAVWDALSRTWGVDLEATFAVGGWADVLRGNVAAAFFRIGSLAWQGRLFKVLGVFVIGLWAGRRLACGTLLSDTALLRRVLAWGLGLGLPANVAFAVLSEGPGDYPPSVAGIATPAVYAAGVVPLGLAYAAGFVLLWRRAAWRRALRAVVPAGRMALTNYLVQSLVGIGLFYGIGLGWAGRVGPVVWTTVGLAVFAVQVALSAWWLRRFRYGPAEWAWRRLTYGHPLAMRRRPSHEPRGRLPRQDRQRGQKA